MQYVKNNHKSSSIHTGKKSEFTWARYGGYECSSQGDSRFSALYATMPDGRVLEAHYQLDVKMYDVGGLDWRLGKGRPSLDPRHKNRDLLYQDYKDLWFIFYHHNKQLFEELRTLANLSGKVLSDRFATSDINQARALADILNETVSN